MPSAARPPNWSFEETLLAYDLYLRDYASPLRYPDGDHDAVKRLSRDLRTLTLHPEEVRRDPRFRNPDGVARKIQNLMWFATSGDAGSENGSAMDQKVVADLPDPEEVHHLARAVLRGTPLEEARRAAAPALADQPVSLAEYQAAVADAGGELEQQVLSKRRKEQRFLRQYLLQGQPQGQCSFCGRTLPKELLIAAHIQRRADLSYDEKLKFDEIAVLACALGCDALFEAGFIAVAANGTIIATEQEVPDGLRTVLDSLEGRSCPAATPAHLPHFAAHLRDRLQRLR